MSPPSTYSNKIYLQGLNKAIDFQKMSSAHSTEKQQASESIAGISKKIETDKIQMTERELSKMIVKQTNLRELAIQ